MNAAVAEKPAHVVSAEITLQQLGGRRFITMTGAKDLMAGENYLQFGLPENFAIKGINKVRIDLTPSDTYTMHFYACHFQKHTFDTVSVVEGVYCEDLCRIFTDETGLATSL